MSFFEEAQKYEIDFYGLKNALFLHVTERSMKAFDKADNRRNRIKTKDEFLKYQEKSRAAFLKSMGTIPYDKNLPLDAKVTGTSVYEDITIENILYRSREGVYVTANLYLPKRKEGQKLPAVLMQCGHSADGRLAYNYRRVAMIIAKAGLALLIFDPVGQGERRSYPELFSDTMSPVYEHQYCGNQCVLAGNSLTAYFLADAMKGIDYLQSRPEIDAEKIGTTGASGGGTLSSALAVVDDRIKAVAPCVFITTRRDYMYTGSRQDMEQVWFGVTENLFDHYELVSSFCPKPYMILGAKSDFFCREGTEKVFNKNKEFYGLFGKQDNLRITWDDCTHSYSPALARASAEFFADVFLGKKIKAKSEDLPDDYSHLVASKTGRIIDESAMPVFEHNMIEFKKKSITGQKNKLLKNIYKNRTPVPPNVRHISSDIKDGIKYEKIIWFSQEFMPCYGVLFSNEGDNSSPVEICLWEDGTDKIAEYSDLIKNHLSQNKRVLVADLSGLGKLAPYPLTTSMSPERNIMKLNADLMFLGDSICAIRCFDLINTINMLKNEYNASCISLYTDGKFCTYADILDKIDMHFETTRSNPITPIDIITNKLYDDSFTDNILMQGLGLLLK